MCKRFTPLSHDEAQDILDAFTEGKPIRLPDKDINDAKYDAFPGKTSPMFLSDGKGGLVLMEATWGFPTTDGKKLIFNTRLDTALRHLASGEGMWFLFFFFQKSSYTPKSERRIAYIIKFLSVGPAVPTVVQLFRIVFFRNFFIRTITEVYTLNFSF